MIHYHGTPITPINAFLDVRGCHFCVSHAQPQDVARAHQYGQSVIPDVIDGGSQLQDALIREWPFGNRGAPVWHMDEPLNRLLKLVDEWPRVCVGSTDEFSVVLSDPWKRKMGEVWDAVSARHRHLPWLHMLRGMQLSGGIYPFASVDSTDIAQNHNRPQNTPRKMALKWDALQTPGTWITSENQMELAV